MWLILALLSAILLALVIIFDRFIVVNVFTSAYQGLIITIPTSAVIFIGLFPLFDWPEPRYILITMICGCCLQAAQIFYFHAMSTSDEAGGLSALESTFPIFVAIISIFLGKALLISQWFGISIILICTLIISIEKLKKANRIFFILIFFDALFLAIHSLIADYVLDKISFMSFYGPYSLSIVIFGCLPFIILKNERKALAKVWARLADFMPHLCLMEIANILSVVLGIRSIQLGHPALATSVMSTYPGIVFIYGAILSYIPVFRKHGFTRPEHLTRNLLLTCVIAFGLGLLI